MDRPVVAQKSPFAVELKAGQQYWWCRCGQSKNQPFCDGAHKTTSFTPLGFTASETKTFYLCGCKNTKNQPFCDGTHSTL